MPSYSIARLGKYLPICLSEQTGLFAATSDIKTANELSIRGLIRRSDAYLESRTDSRKRANLYSLLHNWRLYNR